MPDGFDGSLIQLQQYFLHRMRIRMRMRMRMRMR